MASLTAFSAGTYLKSKGFLQEPIASFKLKKKCSKRFTCPTAPGALQTGNGKKYCLFQDTNTAISLCRDVTTCTGVVCDENKKYCLVTDQMFVATNNQVSKTDNIGATAVGRMEFVKSDSGVSTSSVVVITSSRVIFTSVTQTTTSQETLQLSTNTGLLSTSSLQATTSPYTTATSTIAISTAATSTTAMANFSTIQTASTTIQTASTTNQAASTTIQTASTTIQTASASSTATFSVANSTVSVKNSTAQSSAPILDNYDYPKFSFLPSTPPRYSDMWNSTSSNWNKPWGNQLITTSDPTKFGMRLDAAAGSGIWHLKKSRTGLLCSRITTPHADGINFAMYTTSDGRNPSTGWDEYDIEFVCSARNGVSTNFIRGVLSNTTIPTLSEDGSNWENDHQYCLFWDHNRDRQGTVKWLYDGNIFREEIGYWGMNDTIEQQPVVSYWSRDAKVGGGCQKGSWMGNYGYSNTTTWIRQLTVTYWD